MEERRHGVVARQRHGGIDGRGMQGVTLVNVKEREEEEEGESEGGGLTVRAREGPRLTEGGGGSTTYRTDEDEEGKGKAETGKRRGRRHGQKGSDAGYALGVQEPELARGREGEKEGGREKGRRKVWDRAHPPSKHPTHYVDAEFRGGSDFRVYRC